MMGNLIAFTGCKGGCGVTTLIAALGRELAALNRKTCLVDLCFGLRGLDMALRVQDKVVFDLLDLSQDVCSMEQALIQIGDNLHLIAAPQMNASDDWTEKSLRHVLERLKKRFDFVLLDVPAVTDPLARMTCDLADETVIVTEPGDMADRNAERVCALLREKPDAHLRLLMNRFSDRLVKDGRIPMPDATSAYLDVPLLGVIPRHEEIYAASFLKQPARELPAPVQSALHDAALRLTGEEVPLKQIRTRRFPWLS